LFETALETVLMWAWL